MVGIPKSNRCDFCRRRKTKCDEVWPTCGNCRKAGKECSGPSKRVKFVNNGRHTRADKEKSNLVREVSTISLSDELLNIKNRTTADGATFSKLRVCARKPPVPAKVPGSSADLLAGQVIMYLRSSEGTGYSLSMFLSTLGYAPPLLEKNEALFDATNLLLSTWLKLCRGKSPEDMFDLASYSRSLRSLQKVLNDPKEQTSSATLAAAIYLQTTEYLFDYTKGVNQVSHSNGIYSLMMARGPPKPGDNFGSQLILDSFAFLFRLLLAGDIDNFFVRPEWQNALTSFFVQFKSKVPVILEMSKLVLYSTMVADATKRFSKIRNICPELLDAQELEGITATIDDIATKFGDLDRCTLDPLLRSKKIYEEPDPESPVGASYTFPSGLMSLYFANTAAFRIVTNRLKQELNAMFGLDDPNLEAECLEWSARIWKICRFSQTLKPLCAVSFNTPICVSYTSAPPEVWSYLIAKLKEIEGYRKQPVSR